MEANVLDCGRFRGVEGCNDNTDGFGLVVRRRGAGVDQVGGRSMGREDPKENRQEIWGENGGDGGWPLPNNKKTLKERSGQSLYSMELMLLSMGSSMGVVRLLLCRSPLASIRSVHTPAQGDLRQTLNSQQ